MHSFKSAGYTQSHICSRHNMAQFAIFCCMYVQLLTMELAEVWDAAQVSTSTWFQGVKGKSSTIFRQVPYLEYPLFSPYPHHHLQYTHKICTMNSPSMELNESQYHFITIVVLRLLNTIQ